MTLIVSFVSRYAVCQMSDRQVSLRDGRGYDDHSNKTVIYAAKDALIAISYTGTAYIDGVNTDVKIASILTGETPTEFCHGIHSRREPLKRVTVGIALRRLQDGLTKTLYQRRANTLNQFLCLSIVGWQWRRRDIDRANRDSLGYLRTFRPICLELNNKGATRFILYNLLSRYWHLQSTAGRYMFQIYLHGSGSEHTIVQDYIKDHPLILPVEKGEEVLAPVFPLANTVDRHVGKSAVSVCMVPIYHDNGAISSTPFPFCRIRFIPDPSQALPDKREKEILDTLDLDERSVFYTPFVLTPKMSMPPMIFAGPSWQLNAGFFRMQLGVSDRRTGSVLLAPLRRRPNPGSRTGRR